MERVFAGVSSGSNANRFDLSRFASDRSPKPGDRRFSEDDYTSKFYFFQEHIYNICNIYYTCIDVET